MHGTINVTGRAVKAGRGTGNIGLDDDKNGGSTGGSKMCGTDERWDNLSGSTDNEEGDIKDREKDVEE